MLPDGLEQTFRNHGCLEEFQKFTDLHHQLTSRTEASLKGFSGRESGDPERIRAGSLMYRQTLLHRSICLFEGSLSGAVDENPYSMTLNIRGHYETTASLGYVHSRLSSLRKGTIRPETMDEELVNQLLAGRHISLTYAPDPTNILSLFEYADKSVSASVLEGTPNQYNILRENYEFLCEFSHPNFHSNQVAFDLDTSIPGFVFRHGQKMREREFELIGYLRISTPIFLSLYDQIPELHP